MTPPVSGTGECGSGSTSTPASSSIVRVLPAGAPTSALIRARGGPQRASRSSASSPCATASRACRAPSSSAARLRRMRSASSDSSSCSGSPMRSGAVFVRRRLVQARRRRRTRLSRCRGGRARGGRAAGSRGASAPCPRPRPRAMPARLRPPLERLRAGGWSGERTGTSMAASWPAIQSTIDRYVIPAIETVKLPWVRGSSPSPSSSACCANHREPARGCPARRSAGRPQALPRSVVERIRAAGGRGHRRCDLCHPFASERLTFTRQQARPFARFRSSVGPVGCDVSSVCVA